MYMTVMYPEIAPMLERFGTGLWPAWSQNKYFLVIKASKEMILTARFNKGFFFYLAPVRIGSIQTFSLITTFHDDDNEPLTLSTPLLVDAGMTHDFLKTLQHDSFEVFFLDDHNREILSYRAGGDFSSLRHRIASAALLERGSAQEMLDRAEYWFAQRGEADDAQAVRVNLIEPLTPENFSILDMQNEKHLFHGSKGFSQSTLEYGEPGPYQELDIALLLRQIYPGNRIFLNPIKTSDGKELADAMVVGDEAVLLIQAKDSPNTEKSLRTSIERKQIKSKSQLVGGIRQLDGAVGEIRRNPVLRLRKGDDAIEVDLTGRFIIGIVIVKELFNSLYAQYSATALEFIDKHQVPMVFFDYPELAEVISQCRSEDARVAEDTLLAICHQIFAVAMETEEFPRFRYRKQPTA